MLVNDIEKYILQDDVRRFGGPFVCTIILLVGLFVPLGIDLNPKLAKLILTLFLQYFIYNLFQKKWHSVNSMYLK